MEEFIAYSAAATVGAIQILRLVSWGLGKIAPRTENTVDDAVLSWTRAGIVTLIQLSELLRGGSPSRAEADKIAS